eukprot:4184259-Pleurochrysis_carterae.AAC.4
MLPGTAHEMTWQTNDADGRIQYHRIVTPQPQPHALDRKWRNIVDIHSKLCQAQGSASIADTWATRSWVERHFAEGIGAEALRQRLRRAGAQRVPRAIDFRFPHPRLGGNLPGRQARIVGYAHAKSVCDDGENAQLAGQRGHRAQGGSTPPRFAYVRAPAR